MIWAASDGSSPPPQRRGTSDPVPCYLYGDAFAGGAAVTDPTEGQKYFLVCRQPDGGGTVRVITYQRARPVVDAATLARQAYRTLPLDYPDPQTAPPRTSRQLDGVKTWLWIDPAAYRTITATVGVPGLQVTATATPTAVRWEMGDGSPAVSCNGPGTAYDPTRADDAQATDCGHVYQHSGAYTATVEIEWRVTWSATDGTSGTLPPVTRGVSFDVTVDERQAVLSR